MPKGPKPFKNLSDVLKTQLLSFHSYLGADWVFLRQLYNSCSAPIRKGQSWPLSTRTSNNLSNPLKFWTTIKSIFGNEK